MEKKSDENKAFNRILFYRPHTPRPPAKYFTETTGNCAVLSLFFLYIYVYVDECKYTGCFSFQVWKFIGSFCGWV